jgi:uncharacterized protein YegL
MTGLKSLLSSEFITSKLLAYISERGFIIMANLFKASDFTAPKAKPLPIILLLDESGSMYGESISSLNDAVRKMLATFKKEETQASEFLVSIVAFGGATARLVNEPLPASQIEYSDLNANGGTPLGSAIGIAKTIIDDKEKTPSRAYRPLAVLVSDGIPTDNWESRFNDFIENGRTAKCDRMALAIGAGADRGMLGRFVAGTGHEVFEAKDASEIVKFFKFVTMSVVTRTQSSNPNVVPQDSTLEPPVSVTGQEPAIPSPVPTDINDDEEGYW